MTIMERAGAAAQTSYEDFLARKRIVAPATGREMSTADVHPSLFGFQAALVRWAVRKGRCALFCGTGLGKTRMSLEWARLLGQRTLVIAPLGVARQTVAEGAHIGVAVEYARRQDEAAPGGGITITNYEMAHHFDPAAFGAVVLDESSILAALDNKSRARLTAMFRATPYRLCCTATPAPNDIAEMANHAEFLGVMRRVDMLASFFVHDNDGWRLKGHAAEPFYRWLASWAMAVQMPGDIGYPDEGYVLPALTVEPLWVDGAYVPDGQLFFTDLKGIGDRVRVRRGTLAARVAAAAALVNASQEPWICWCGLNEESAELARAIPDAVEVAGSDSADAKADKLAAFAAGRVRVLVSKARIAGFGLNLQHCAHMVFVGLSDSWQAYYQCIRRCWRFGQTAPVHVYIVLSTHEEGIYRNVMRKEEEAKEMSTQLVAHVRDMEQQELGAQPAVVASVPHDRAAGAMWDLLLGDSVERLAEVAADSVHLSVYSPPFSSLYTYSPTEHDVGNNTSDEDFIQHYGYVIADLLRVTVPGRNTCVHVSDIPAMLVRDGYIGLKDFPGLVIRAYEEHGWIYHGRIAISKNPQAQAVRTHSKSLLFVQLRKDASWSRPALADYILVFRKPGDNPIPIHPDISNDQWIEWAQPLWTGIRENHTLQYTTARSEEDERHIAPLQLDVVERCIRLWSNRGETVLSPFAGIGTEVYEAVRLGRRGLGIELKPSYYAVACDNMRQLAHDLAQPTLFDDLEPLTAGAGSADGVAR